MLSAGDMALFLADQRRSLMEKMAALEAQFTNPHHLLSAAEAKLVVLCEHSGDILQMYSDGECSIHPPHR